MSRHCRQRGMIARSKREVRQGDAGNAARPINCMARCSAMKSIKPCQSRVQAMAASYAFRHTDDARIAAPTFLSRRYKWGPTPWRIARKRTCSIQVMASGCRRRPTRVTAPWLPFDQSALDRWRGVGTRCRWISGFSLGRKSRGDVVVKMAMDRAGAAALDRFSAIENCFGLGC